MPIIPEGMISAYSDNVENPVIPDEPGVSGISVMMAIGIWKKKDSRIKGFGSYFSGYKKNMCHY